jgi:hypothetical protein
MATKNQMSDLREHLFNTLEALSDKEKPMAIERAAAICDVAQVLVNTAKVEVQYLGVVGQQGISDFFPAAEEHRKRALPAAPQPHDKTGIRSVRTIEPKERQA